jgi:hypothetical protein
LSGAARVLAFGGAGLPGTCVGTEGAFAMNLSVGCRGKFTIRAKPAIL